MPNEKKYLTHPYIAATGNYHPHGDIACPIAEEIVKLLADKKISYGEAEDALHIALEGIKTLTLVEKEAAPKVQVLEQPVEVKLMLDGKEVFKHLQGNRD